jgi:hypothetical protein
MTHTAIQEHLDGKVVEWMEKVSDEQYGARLGNLCRNEIWRAIWTPGSFWFWGHQC